MKLVKGQPKWQSFIESLVNVIVGFSVAYATQLVVFPAVGIHITGKTNLLISIIFTVVSLIRSYLLRRLFNLWLLKGKDVGYTATIQAPVEPRVLPESPA